MLYFGEITSENQAEQVKGINYDVSEFIGENPIDLQNGIIRKMVEKELEKTEEEKEGEEDKKKKKKKDDKVEVEKIEVIEKIREKRNETKLFHITMYLAPGDYHGIHSPCKMTIERRKHFPGMLKEE